MARLGATAGCIFAGLGLLLGAPAAAAEPSAVRAVFVADGVPLEPGAGAWRQAPEAALGLSAQIILPPNGGGSVGEVRVQALHDGESIALRLSWADRTADREVGVATFRDAVALGFPVADSSPPPSPFMGDAEHPVDIWQWTADLDATARGRGGFAERYPHTEGVWYSPQDAAVQREVRAWRGTEPVAEFAATGFGTLTRRPTRNVTGASDHRDGRWVVVLRRALATGDPNDAPFRPGETTQLIVAVWDGSAGDVNGRKSVTLSWVPLSLDATQARDGAP